MDSLFITIDTKYDDCPIVLIDTSGSVQSTMLLSVSVLDREIEIIQKNLKGKGIQNIYLMFWNSHAYVINDGKPINTCDIQKFYNNRSGATYLYPALNSIPSHWLQKKMSDIYIITDGNIFDKHEDISRKIKSLVSKNSKIYIQ